MNISHLIHTVRMHTTLNNGVLAAAAVLTVMGIWNTVGTLQKNFILQQKLNDMEKQIQITEIEVETLRLKQQYLKSNEYKELVARQSLGKAASGEKVVILPASPKSKPVAASAIAKVPDSNFELWMRFFFGHK